MEMESFSLSFCAYNNVAILPFLTFTFLTGEKRYTPGMMLIEKWLIFMKRYKNKNIEMGRLRDLFYTK
jgi:hypothetical protein